MEWQLKDIETREQERFEKMPSAIKIMAMEEYGLLKKLDMGKCDSIDFKRLKSLSILLSGYEITDFCFENSFF